MAVLTVTFRIITHCDLCIFRVILVSYCCALIVTDYLSSWHQDGETAMDIAIKKGHVDIVAKFEGGSAA